MSIGCWLVLLSRHALYPIKFQFLLFPLLRGCCSLCKYYKAGTTSEQVKWLKNPVCAPHFGNKATGGTVTERTREASCPEEQLLKRPAKHSLLGPAYSCLHHLQNGSGVPQFLLLLSSSFLNQPEKHLNDLKASPTRMKEHKRLSKCASELLMLPGMAQ